MDKVILLKQHMKTFYIFENNQTYDSEGEVIGDTTVSQFEGVLLPLSNSDLQRLDRGDVSFTNKKIYTKKDFKNGDQFVDGNSQEMLHYSEEINQREELAYYRLLQYDMDGAYEVFDPIAIYCLRAEIVGIYDMLGRYVGTDTKYLAHGAYIVLLSNNQTRQISL